MKRCSWANSGNQLLKKYHDQEWGVPCHNDQKLFEFLSLGTMQAGLSWQTILNKRAALKKALANFDFEKLQFFKNRLPQLLANPAIIRNRRKLLAIIHNACLVSKMRHAHQSLSDYFWQFIDYRPIVHHYKTHEQIPTTNNLAQHISHTLKADGFQFTGPTIIYSFLQAMGLINDHEISCFRYKALIPDS